MKIGFLACAGTLPGSDRRRDDAYEHDQQIAALRPAIEEAGGSLSVIDWRAPPDQLAVFDAMLLGTVWDYQDHAADFLALLDRLAEGGTQICNPPAMVRWNIDKRYLADLASRGVPTIPTLWLENASTPAVTAAFTRLDCDRLVVKRQIGAGAEGQHSFARTSPPPPDWKMNQACMIQPFIRAIENEGEISFIFIDGAFSHAVLKQAAPGDYRIQSLYGGRESMLRPQAEDIAAAHHVLSNIPFATPLYARVDMVRGRDKGLLLMEAELIEPYLYPEQGPQLGPSLAAALKQRLSSRQPA